MRCFDFDTAIVRFPGCSVVDGLRDHDGPGPTYEGVSAEHSAYRAALQQAGLTVHVLDPLEDHPDAIFVEDPALVFSNAAVLLKPGAASRQSEAAYLHRALAEHFDSIVELPEGHVDGGDVLVTPSRVLIGLSTRTDARGAAALIEVLALLGMSGEAVTPPGGMLHLKTQATLIDEETVLLTPAAERSGLFASFRQIVVDPREEGAANALRVNDKLLVGGQHRATTDRLSAEGYDLIRLDTTEIQRIDAGLTCMSLRWSRASRSSPADAR